MRIILVEDSPSMSKVLRVLLAPVEVIVCETLAQAEMIMSGATQNDTVLLDLQLPDSRPASTLLRLTNWKERENCPRVVIITGSEEPQVLCAAERLADGLALKNDGEGFYRQLEHLGVLKRNNRPCANRETIEEIEDRVAALCGPGSFSPA